MLPPALPKIDFPISFRVKLSRAQIRDVRGFEFEPTSNTLDVYVMYLRRERERQGEPRIVHTVHGLGYTLRVGSRSLSGGSCRTGSGLSTS